MCGIIGYIGKRDAREVILHGLEKSETRGYHGFGIGVRKGKKIITFKRGGEDSAPAFFKGVKSAKLPFSKEGIGHNRWATKGDPTTKNAHPHYSTDQSLIIVHNGIIENINALTEEMRKHSFPTKFVSETDTEILGSWIAFIAKELKLPFKDALKIALKQVQGSYAIICMLPSEPGVLYAAACGSSMWIGVGEYKEQKEYFIASETPPFLRYTQNFVKINSNRIVIVNSKEYIVETFDGVKENPKVRKINADLRKVEKGVYRHWMMKEIMEQDHVLMEVMQGRVSVRHSIKVKGITNFESKFRSINRLFVVAHGTSFYAACVFKHILEEYTGILVNVELSSEFCYRKTPLQKGDIVIGVSQSGETKDTFTALEEARKQGAYILGICNVEGSQIAEMTDAGIFLRAGTENGVASTKAFTAQLAVFAMLTIHIASIRGSITEDNYELLRNGLLSLPEHVKRSIAMTEKPAKLLAKKYSFATSMYYLGRGINYSIAREGALKLKEIAGIHAEGYSASEMKHGPIGLIGPHMPVICIMTDSSTFEKSLMNLQEAKTRKAPVIAIVSEDADQSKILADDYIVVPKVMEFFSPIINVIALQFFAYYMAILKRKNPDKPRGLAKAVTVE